LLFNGAEELCVRDAAEIPKLAAFADFGLEWKPDPDDPNNPDPNVGMLGCWGNAQKKDNDWKREK
jgi:hypothetical protein